jgi:signal transduction histidine kinase
MDVQTLKAGSEMPDGKINSESSMLTDIYRQQYTSFIDMAAHDLQSPLRKLGVLIDRLTSKYKNSGDEEVIQYTNRINTCIAEMRLLIEGFTGLASAVPQNMKYENCNLEQIINRIIQEFSALIKEKQAKISLNGLPEIQGDIVQLRLLFKKILDNAFRFSREDVPLVIDISAEKISDSDIFELNLPVNKTFYSISIGDNGIGFDDHDNEKIFQPLVRLHGKSEFAGQGMGLAIAKRIIENHGGLIFAEGSDNGARFKLIIPEKAN